MPLLFLTHPDPSATFAVWYTTEEEAFFRQNTPLSAEESAEFEPLKGPRRIEWLAGRWLLHHISGSEVRLPLAKDAFSKPFFPDTEQLACSLSHSHGVVGALLFRTGQTNCGCDIQVLVDKMPRLVHKFLRPEEAEFIQRYAPDEQFVLQHLFWTAKESLYKSYGVKSLDFREHIQVLPFNWDGHRTLAYGLVDKGGIRQRYRLFSALERPDDAPAFVWTLCLPD